MFFLSLLFFFKKTFLFFIKYHFAINLKKMQKTEPWRFCFNYFGEAIQVGDKVNNVSSTDLSDRLNDSVETSVVLDLMPLIYQERQ